MKKLVCLVLAIVMTLALVTCASAEFKFERKITIVCPWGVGGGADSTIRPMATLLQDILGVPVEVVNVEGAAGVNGVEYTYKQPADGYTFMLGTQSLFMQDMSSTTSMDFKTEFQAIDVLVHSVNTVSASKIGMERIGVTNWEELVAYIAEHPFEVSVGMLTLTGVDGASFVQATQGLDLNMLSYSSGSEVNSAMVGGHCDLSVGGFDEIAGLLESGDVLPMLTLTEQRLPNYPDVPCSTDVGLDSFMAPWRAIFCVKGTPQEAIDAMIAAVEEARQTESWQEFLKNASYDQRPVPTVEELPEFVQSEYKLLRDFMAEQGTLTKDYDDLK